MGVSDLLIAVVTAVELSFLEVEDEVTEEVAREADCKDDFISVCPVAVGTECEGFVVAAVTMLSNVGVPLPLPTVISLAAHCPAYAQYWSEAQQIDPHDVSPNPLSQITDVAHCPAYSQYWSEAQQIDPHVVSSNPLLQVDDVAVAAAVLEVCAGIELAGAETVRDEVD